MTMLRNFLIVAAACCSSAALAAAQTSACANASSQLELNQCASVDAKAADAELNRTYTTVLARLSKTGQARLRTAQRAWIDFRDKECTFESNGADGGSVAPMIATNCATRLTNTRTKELGQFKQCQEGDLSCPR